MHDPYQRIGELEDRVTLLRLEAERFRAAGETILAAIAEDKMRRTAERAQRMRDARIWAAVEIDA